MKKEYKTPKLEEFGTVSELSAGGAGSRVENTPDMDQGAFRP